MHEARKDRELTQRLEQTERARRMLENVDLRHDEARIDAELQAREKRRDLSRVIVHCDCDAFYASVEELERPELRSLPLAVGAGVLSTTNYVARSFGVRSAMSTHIARKICPQLVLIKPDFKKYTAKAQEIRAVLAEYDSRFCSASLDEAYLDITAVVATRNTSPEAVVEEMRARIYERTQLTVSCGIAANMRVAKICSNMRKPNGQFLVANERDAIMSFMRTLPVRQVNGIGRVAERQLGVLGVKVCGDIYTHRAVLQRLLGDKMFDFLLDVYLGLGQVSVRPAEEVERKSIGCESTFSCAKSTRAELEEQLRVTAEELVSECQRAGVAGRTLHVKLKRDTFDVITRQRSIPAGAVGACADEICRLAWPMVEREMPITLRLFGLRLTGLEPLAARPDHASLWQTLLEKAPLAETTITNKTETTPTRCPICATVLHDDGPRAVNDHIDACLSKEAIREAVRAVSEPPPAQQMAVSTARERPLARKRQRTHDLRDWVKRS